MSENLKGKYFLRHCEQVFILYFNMQNFKTTDGIYPTIYNNAINTRSEGKSTVEVEEGQKLTFLAFRFQAKDQLWLEAYLQSHGFKPGNIEGLNFVGE